MFFKKNDSTFYLLSDKKRRKCTFFDRYIRKIVIYSNLENEREREREENCENV